MNSWILQKLGGRDVSLLLIEELELSVRTAHCLKNMGIHIVGQLMEMNETQLLRNDNFGHKSLNQLKTVLAEFGVEIGSTEILTIEKRMKRAMARAQAAKAAYIKAKTAYAEAVSEVQQITKQMVTTNLDEIVSCVS
jgi:hypothetical protein